MIMIMIMIIIIIIIIIIKIIVPTDEGQSGPKRLAKFALYPAEWCCFDKRRERTDVLWINK